MRQNTLTTQASDRFPELPSDESHVVGEALYRFGERVGVSLRKYLKERGIDSVAHLLIAGRSLEVLFELAAVIQIDDWHTSGLLDYLPGNDLCPKHAKESLLQQLLSVSEHDKVMIPAGEQPLLHRVLRIWAQNFAWDGQSLLQADILLGEIDDDALIDALAKFLWRNRKELTTDET